VEDAQYSLHSQKYKEAPGSAQSVGRTGLIPAVCSRYSLQSEEPKCSQKQKQELSARVLATQSENVGDSHLVCGTLPPMLHPEVKKHWEEEGLAFKFYE
jgi:hypothetical protein